MHRLRLFHPAHVVSDVVRLNFCNNIHFAGALDIPVGHDLRMHQAKTALPDAVLFDDAHPMLELLLEGSATAWDDILISLAHVKEISG